MGVWNWVIHHWWYSCNDIKMAITHGEHELLSNGDFRQSHAFTQLSRLRPPSNSPSWWLWIIRLVYDIAILTLLSSQIEDPCVSSWFASDHSIWINHLWNTFPTSRYLQQKSGDSLSSPPYQLAKNHHWLSIIYMNHHYDLLSSLLLLLTIHINLSTKLHHLRPFSPPNFLRQWSPYFLR